MYVGWIPGENSIWPWNLVRCRLYSQLATPGMWTWRQDSLGREKLCEPNSDIFSHRKSQRFIWKASRWKYCYVTSEPYFVEESMQPIKQGIWIEQTCLFPHTHTKVELPIFLCLSHRINSKHEFKCSWAREQLVHARSLYELQKGASSGWTNYQKKHLSF